MSDTPAQANVALPFWKNPSFKIDRYMDEFHRLAVPNSEIEAIEEKCVRERFDPAEAAHRRSLRHAHVPGTPDAFN